MSLDREPKPPSVSEQERVVAMVTHSNFIKNRKVRASRFKKLFRPAKLDTDVFLTWYGWWLGGNLSGIGKITKIGKRTVTIKPLSFITSERYTFDPYLDGSLRSRFGLPPKPYSKSSGMLSAKKITVGYWRMRGPDEVILEP